MANTTREVDVGNQLALQEFIALEHQFLSSYEQFVAESDINVLRLIQGKSAYLETAKWALLVSSENGEDVARCIAIINPKYQQNKKEAVGFIGLFAAKLDNNAAVLNMLHYAEDWLKEHSVSRIIGPYNGASTLGLGLLTANYDESPMFPFRWYPPYYCSYFEAAGYEARYPLWTYSISFDHPTYLSKIEEAVDARIKVRPINKANFSQELEIFRTLFNQTFADTWEVYPYNSQEIQEFFAPLQQLLDANLLLFAEVNNKPVGFCLGLPDWNPLFRLFQGELGEKQFKYLTKNASYYKRAGIISIGVDVNYRGLGIARAMLKQLFEYFETKGLKEALYYPVNNSNVASRNFVEQLGGKGEVTYLCFDKRVG